MSNPENPSVSDELMQCSQEIYGSPVHGKNAMHYLDWIRYPVGQVWFERGGYYMSTQVQDREGVPIDVPDGAKDEQFLAKGVEMMAQAINAPYEFIGRPPVGNEMRYRRHTVAIIDKGPYTMERVSAFAQERKFGEHALHGVLGAMFDTICVAAQMKSPDKIVPYQTQPSISRDELLGTMGKDSASRTYTLNKLIDSILSRQVQTLRPDRKGELEIQGELEFGSCMPTIRWQSMTYVSLNALVGRHRPASPARKVLEQIVQSQNLA